MTVTVCISLEDKSNVTLSRFGMQSPGMGCVSGLAGVGEGEGEGQTYSTFLDQGGGSLMVMNTQLVKMVIIMNMLNSVEGKVKESERAGGEGRCTEASSPRAPPSAHPQALPASPRPCACPTWAGYEWMSTLMAPRLMMLKGLSM